MEYRLYQKGDEKEIVDLLTQAFNGWPKIDLPVSSVEHWKWKFMDNPYGSLVALSNDNNHIVGCQHILFKKIKVGNNEYDTAIGVDIALHSDYRGKGEYGRLSNFKKEHEEKINLKFRNYVQGNKNLIKRDLKMGNPLFPHKIYNTIRISNYQEYLRGKDLTVGKFGLLSLVTINKTKNKFLNRKLQKIENLHIHEISVFDERIINFWHRIKDDFKFIFVRDREYLNWRYCDERGGKYTVFLAEIDGDIVCYCVLRINLIIEDNPVGYIVDLVVDPSRITVLSSLLDVVIDYFDERGVNRINLWSTDNEVFSYFSRSGFIKIPDRIHLTFRKESLVAEDYKVLLASNVNEVQFSYGDHDWI